MAAKRDVTGWDRHVTHRVRHGAGVVALAAALITASVVPGRADWNIAATTETIKDIYQTLTPNSALTSQLVSSVSELTIEMARRLGTQMPSDAQRALRETLTDRATNFLGDSGTGFVKDALIDAVMSTAIDFAADFYGKQAKSNAVRGMAWFALNEIWIAGKVAAEGGTRGTVLINLALEQTSLMFETFKRTAEEYDNYKNAMVDAAQSTIRMEIAGWRANGLGKALFQKYYAATNKAERDAARDAIVSGARSLLAPYLSGSRNQLLGTDWKTVATQEFAGWSGAIEHDLVLSGYAISRRLYDMLRDGRLQDAEAFEKANTGLSTITSRYRLDPTFGQPVGEPWSCDFTINTEVCRRDKSGQLSISATNAGSKIAQTNSQAIITRADYSAGIVLQARTAFDRNMMPMSYQHPAMTLTNRGLIVTTGRGSPGISSHNYGGNIGLINRAAIVTYGQQSDGIKLLGGGIDATGMIMSGGGLTVDNTSRISVQGSDSAAISVQSGSWYRDPNGKDQLISGGNVIISNSGAISSAGWAGVHGSSFGGTVNIDNTGTIAITGYSGAGLSASSRFGGGSAIIRNGGNITIGWNDSNGIEAEADKGNVSITNVGQIRSSALGVSGIDGVTHTDVGTKAGVVTVDNTGWIGLSGEQSQGLKLSTSSGSVFLKSGADIVMSGADSYGIVVTGTEKASKLNVEIASGTTVQGGSGSTTFSTRSRTGEGDGTALLGSAGIFFLGGGTNTLTNHGTITALNGLAISVIDGPVRIYEWNDQAQLEEETTFDAPVGLTKIENNGLIRGAIRLGAGNDEIVNHGLIKDNISMGGGSNALFNMPGGEIRGKLVSVGADNVFTNRGALSPGGIGVLERTIVIGNFVQTSTGRMVIDINEKDSARSDALQVTGTASIAGKILPNIIDLNRIIKSEYRIVTAAGGINDNGIRADPASVVVDAIGYNFGLVQRGANELYLTAARQDKLSEVSAKATAAVGANAENLASLGLTLDQLEASGGSLATTLSNTLRLQQNATDAGRMLERITPQQQGGQASGASNSSGAFANAMLSCSLRDGEYAYSREGKCYYAKVSVRRLQHDASSGGAGITETGQEVMAGLQFDVGAERRLGLALGFEDISSKSFSQTQDLGSASGGRYQGGLVLKDQWGPVNAYLNLTGSYSRQNIHRWINLAGIKSANAEQDVYSGAARIRLAYLHDMGHWYLKPLVDLSAAYLHLGSYSEVDGGPFNLAVARASNWTFGVSPGLEIGGQVRDASGTIWRPYARAGFMLLDNAGLSVDAAFLDAPAGVDAFRVNSKLDTKFFDFEAGLHMLTTSGLNVRVNYEGRFGDMTRQHAGTIKLSLPY